MRAASSFLRRNIVLALIPLTVVLTFADVLFIVLRADACRELRLGLPLDERLNPRNPSWW